MTYGSIVYELLERLYDRGYPVFGKDTKIEALLEELREADK